MMDNVGKARMKESVMDALPHEPEWARLYHKSPEFHATIQMLGSIAPDLIEQMATVARNQMTARALGGGGPNRWPFDKDGLS